MAKVRRPVAKKKKPPVAHARRASVRRASTAPFTVPGPIQPAFPVPGDQDCTGQITPLAANGTHTLPAGGVIVSVRLVIGANVHIGTIDPTAGAGNWRATFPSVTIPPNTPMAIIVTASCPDGTRELVIPFRHVPPPTNSGVVSSHSDGSTINGNVNITGTISGADRVDVIIDGGTPVDITGMFNVTTDFGGVNGSHQIEILGTSAAGDPDPSPPTFNFTVDTTVPTFTLTQTGAATVLLTFNEDMGSSAFNTASYTLTASDTTVIAISTISQLSLQSALLNLATALTPTETYTLNVASVRDLAGNSIDEDRTFVAT